MSTRQYQAYEDAAEAFEKAKEVLKYTRKEFTDNVRVTGTALRKAFVPDENRTSLGSISTRTTNWSGKNALVGAMEVCVQSAVHHTLNDQEIQYVKDWLLSNGWAVKDSNRYNPHYHVFICI